MFRSVFVFSSLFVADPEELCGSEGLRVSACPSSGPESHDALVHRAHAAEERAHRSEEALARAMDDLHKLRSVAFPVFLSLIGIISSCSFITHQFCRAYHVFSISLLMHFHTGASRGTQWTQDCRTIIQSTLWKKFGGKEEIKKNKRKGKFHCSMEVKVTRGGRKGGNKGKLQKERGWRVLEES